MGSTKAEALQLFLRRLQSRSTLDRAAEQALLDLRGQVDQVDANSDIVRPGESTDHACLVAKGLTARFDQMQDGRRQIVSIYIPGDMCDLHSVPMPTTGWGLEALTATTVLRVPHGDLRQLALDYPQLGFAFWRDTIVDGSILGKWVGNVGRRRALPRLAHLLCELGIRMEQAQLGTRTQFILPATQNHLADATGLTPVHLNRTVRSLRAEGVTFAGRTVRVERWDALASLAEFDPTYLLLPKRGPQRAAGLV